MNDGWQTIDVGGNPADVVAPPDGPPRVGLVFLHDYDLATLAGNAPFTNRLNDHGLARLCALIVRVMRTHLVYKILGALGIPRDCDPSTRAGAHTCSCGERFSARAIRFLPAGLEKERRRLV